MARQVNVPGGCKVQVGLGSSDALVELGYSVDGITVTEKEFTEDVHSDRYGGRQGPPIDVQIFGLGATIDIEFSEFDPEVFVLMQSRMARNTNIKDNQGRAATPGTLLFNNGGTFRTLLYGDLDAAVLTAAPATDLDTLLTPRNFPFTRVIGDLTLPLSAKYSTPRIRIEAYQGLVSGNVEVWNRDVS